MGDSEAKSDFPNSDQRYAFCVSQWDRKKKNVSNETSETSKVTTRSYFSKQWCKVCGKHRAVRGHSNCRWHGGRPTKGLIEDPVDFEHAINDLVANYNFSYTQTHDENGQLKYTLYPHIPRTNSTWSTSTDNSLAVSSEPTALHSGVSFRLNAALVQEVEEDGREYLVTPVVAIREGVLNGEFVPAQEIALSTEQWNGVPITIGHPKLDGNPVSLIQHPEISSDTIIGEFRKATFDGKGLHGEIWIDIELAKKHEEGVHVLDQLRDGDPMDVSTGYIAAVNHQSGVFGDAAYSGVQQGIMPDHLALLPFEKGACSWEDGCGTPRINSEDSDQQDGKEESTIDNKALEALKWLGNALGYNVHAEDQSKIVQNVSDCCRCGNEHTDLEFKKFSQSEEGCPFDIWAICPDTEEPILSVHQLKVNGANLGTLLTQMITDQITNERPRRVIIKAMADLAGTSVDKVKSIVSGDVEIIPNRWLQGFAQALDVSTWDLMYASDRDIQSFLDDKLPKPEAGTEQPFAMQAEEPKENAEEDTGNETDSAEVTVNTEEVTTMPEIRELADAVLANESLSFTDQDREWLETLPEEKLQAMIPQEPEVVEEEPATEELEEEVVNTQPKTIADLLATVENNSLKASLEEMIRTNDEICSGLISQITENSDFTEEELSGKSVSELKKLAALAAPKQGDTTPSYVGAGVPRQQSTEEPKGVPEPPKILTAPVEKRNVN
jgi:hypothetical protein